MPGDPTAVPEEARTRVEQMIAVGYRQHKDGIEDPVDTRVFWTFDQIVKMGAAAFGAVLARRRKARREPL
jgi:hypothetical protein